MSSPLDYELHNLTLDWPINIISVLLIKKSWKITSSMEDHPININVEDLLSNTIAVNRQIEVHPSLMPIDQ